MIDEIQQTDDLFVHTDVFVVAEEHDFVSIDLHDFSDAVMIDMSHEGLSDAVTIDMSMDSDLFVSLEDEVYISDFTTDEHHHHSEIMNIDLFDDMNLA